MKRFVVECAGLENSPVPVLADGYRRNETKVAHITEVVFWKFAKGHQEYPEDSTRMMLVAPWIINEVESLAKAPPAA